MELFADSLFYVPSKLDPLEGCGEWGRYSDIFCYIGKVMELFADSLFLVPSKLDPLEGCGGGEGTVTYFATLARLWSFLQIVCFMSLLNWTRWRGVGVGKVQ